MNRYKRCPRCHGFGSLFDCPCPHCKDGKVACSSCKGTGKIPKRFLFFSYIGQCPSCNGTGSIKCLECGGSGFIETMCPECGGAGKSESTEYKSWVKSLENLSVDRLRFEYEKRQREIESLQIKIYSLTHERDDMEDEYEEWSENHPDAEPEERPLIDAINRAYDEISKSEERISQIQEEMKEIEKVIDKKWK